VLYSRQGPYDRRRSIDASASELFPEVKRVLEVQEGEAPHGIYSHEHKADVIVLLDTNERIESAFAEALQREALLRRSFYGPEPYIVAAGQVGESLGRRAAATVLGSLLPSE
jgi:hypothetical protein